MESSKLICPRCNKPMEWNKPHLPKDCIEQPMHMNLRESQAWQLGWDKGFKAGVESEREKHEKK